MSMRSSSAVRGPTADPEGEGGEGGGGGGRGGGVRRGNDELSNKEVDRIATALFNKGKGKSRRETGGGNPPGGFNGQCYSCKRWGHSAKYCPDAASVNFLEGNNLGDISEDIGIKHTHTNGCFGGYCS